MNSPARAHVGYSAVKSPATPQIMYHMHKQTNKQTNEQTKQSKAKQSKIAWLGSFLYVCSLHWFLLCFLTRLPKRKLRGFVYSNLKDGKKGRRRLVAPASPHITFYYSLNRLSKRKLRGFLYNNLKGGGLMWRRSVPPAPPHITFYYFLTRLS